MISERKLFKANQASSHNVHFMKTLKGYSICSVRSASTLCRKQHLGAKNRTVTDRTPLSQKGQVQSRLLHLQLSVKKLEPVLPELIEADKITEPMG